MHRGGTECGTAAARITFPRHNVDLGELFRLLVALHEFGDVLLIGQEARLLPQAVRCRKAAAKGRGPAMGVVQKEVRGIPALT